MLKIILPILAMLISGCMPQYIKPSDEIKYTQIIKVEGLNKAEIFSKAVQWFSETYNSPNDIISLKDAEAGIIIGRGITNVNAGLGVSNTIYYTVKVEIKDNKVRFSGDKFNWTLHGGKIKLVVALKDARHEMKILANNLDQYLNKPKQQVEDW